MQKNVRGQLFFPFKSKAGPHLCTNGHCDECYSAFPRVGGAEEFRRDKAEATTQGLAERSKIKTVETKRALSGTKAVEKK